MIFGQTFDKDRYWDAIDRACLLPDLAVLPDGDLTEVRSYVLSISVALVFFMATRLARRVST